MARRHPVVCTCDDCPKPLGARDRACVLILAGIATGMLFARVWGLA